MSTKSEAIHAREFLEKKVGPLTFAMAMRAMRTTLDLSQAEMARKIGVSRQNLCDIERGRTLVTPATAAKYAHRAGFSILIAVESCLQDLVNAAGIKRRVSLK